jgi:anaerobic selenocysteine-containing dehydrogenase
MHPDGSPMRIDHAFSWEHPLSAHGMMHNVITNAVKGDPYRIDTLLIFMANMAWNSTMNTMGVREMLNRADDDGEYMIPFLVVCDAFQSEMVAFADLVLPDTTYLERHDVMSMLDRPISEFEGPVDSVRVAVVEPTGECKPFQEVLIELASRLKFPAFTREDGTRKFKDYPDFVVNFQPQPGVGFLMGWRGKDGTEHLRGEPNPKQWEMYAKNNCVFQYHMPPEQQYMRNWNRPTWISPRTRAGASATTRCSWPLFRHAAELSASPRRARPAAGSRPITCASASPPTSTPAFLVRAAGERLRGRPTSSRWPRSRSGRWRCTTRGIRRTPGCARSTATTTCT